MGMTITYTPICDKCAKKSPESADVNEVVARDKAFNAGWKKGPYGTLLCPECHREHVGTQEELKQLRAKK